MHCFDVILAKLFNTPPPPTNFPGGQLCAPLLLPCSPRSLDRVLPSNCCAGCGIGMGVCVVCEQRAGWCHGMLPPPKTLSLMIVYMHMYTHT